MSIKTYCVPCDDAEVEDLRSRLKCTRWPDAIPGSGWEYGADLDYMRQLCRYWEQDFDWKAQVQSFARFGHYNFQVDGVGVHFIHERGKGDNPIPILLTHGWPGSFLEMLKILPMLTDPASHGGDPGDSFDVVIPSLPGFGYSDRPAEAGMNTFRIAELWAELMEALGYPRYGAQGGDFGANVSTILALRHPERMIGLHLNYIPGSYAPYLQPGEKFRIRKNSFCKTMHDGSKSAALTPICREPSRRPSPMP